jgi:hypothetical protein
LIPSVPISAPIFAGVPEIVAPHAALLPASEAILVNSICFAVYTAEKLVRKVVPTIVVSPVKLLHSTGVVRVAR